MARKRVTGEYFLRGDASLRRSCEGHRDALGNEPISLGRAGERWVQHCEMLKAVALPKLPGIILSKHWSVKRDSFLVDWPRTKRPGLRDFRGNAGEGPFDYAQGRSAPHGLLFLQRGAFRVGDARRWRVAALAECGHDQGLFERGIVQVG